MSDETKRVPRLAIGSVWKVSGWEGHWRVDGPNNEESWKVAEVGGGRWNAVSTNRLYRLATDVDLFATGTYEDDPVPEPGPSDRAYRLGYVAGRDAAEAEWRPKPEPFEDSAFGDFLRGLYEQHLRNSAAPADAPPGVQVTGADMRDVVAVLGMLMDRVPPGSRLIYETPLLPGDPP